MVAVWASFVATNDLFSVEGSDGVDHLSEDAWKGVFTFLYRQRDFLIQGF